MFLILFLLCISSVYGLKYEDVYIPSQINEIQVVEILNQNLFDGAGDHLIRYMGDNSSDNPQLDFIFQTNQPYLYLKSDFNVSDRSNFILQNGTQCIQNGYIGLYEQPCNYQGNAKLSDIIDFLNSFYIRLAPFGISPLPITKMYRLNNRIEIQLGELKYSIYLQLDYRKLDTMISLQQVYAVYILFGLIFAFSIALGITLFVKSPVYMSLSDDDDDEDDEDDKSRDDEY